MRSLSNVVLTLVLGSIGTFAAPPLRAQTVLNGNYSNNPTFSGHVVTSGTYAVVDPATFNNNHGSGLVADADSGSITLVINGGQFENNTLSGLHAQANGGNAESITINGGNFSGNAEGSILTTAGPLTITGGTFGSSSTDVGNIDVSGNGPASNVMIEGGVYTGTAVNFESDGSATLVGYFPGQALGTVELPGTSSVYGELEYAAAPQTFTYSGGITIDNLGTTFPSTPEPAPLALVSLGGLAMGRRRSA